MARFEKIGNLERPIQRIEQAIAKDAKVALAYASFGEAQWLKAVQSNGSRESAAKAILYAKRAIEYAKLGNILAKSGKQVEGIQALQRLAE